MNKEPMGVAAILRKDNKVALCQRIDPTRDFCGKMAFAGGGVEEYELHNPLLAVIREVKEETGLDVYRPQIQYMYPAISEGNCLRCLYYVVYLDEDQIPQHTEPHKHGPWKFYTYDEAMKLDLIDNMRPALKYLYE